MRATKLWLTFALLVFVCSLSATEAEAQQGAAQPPAVVIPPGTPEIVLWPAGAPGSEARKDEPEEIRGETIVNVHNPSIFVFQAPPEMPPVSG